MTQSETTKKVGAMQKAAKLNGPVDLLDWGIDELDELKTQLEKVVEGVGIALDHLREKTEEQARQEQELSELTARHEAQSEEQEQKARERLIALGGPATAATAKAARPAKKPIQGKEARTASKKSAGKQKTKEKRISPRRIGEILEILEDLGKRSEVITTAQILGEMCERKVSKNITSARSMFNLARDDLKDAGLKLAPGSKIGKFVYEPAARRAEEPGISANDQTEPSLEGGRTNSDHIEGAAAKETKTTIVHKTKNEQIIDIVAGLDKGEGVEAKRLKNEMVRMGISFSYKAAGVKLSRTRNALRELGLARIRTGVYTTSKVSKEVHASSKEEKAASSGLETENTEDTQVELSGEENQEGRSKGLDASMLVGLINENQDQGSISIRRLANLLVEKGLCLDKEHASDTISVYAGELAEHGMTIGLTLVKIKNNMRSSELQAEANVVNGGWQLDSNHIRLLKFLLGGGEFDHYNSIDKDSLAGDLIRNGLLDDGHSLTDAGYDALDAKL